MILELSVRVKVWMDPHLDLLRTIGCRDIQGYNKKSGKERVMRRLWLVWLLVLLGLGFLAYPMRPAVAQAEEGQPLVLVLTAEGPLTPVLVGYIERGIQVAQSEGAEAIILQLNTPGGSIDLMNRIIQRVRSSPVPVIVYVAPRGAMAGSAGTLITLAGHASAMAPETAIGAASPVGSQGEDLGETLATKEKEILRATARSLAERRPPAAVQLAEGTIEKARAVSSTEALQVGLVDFIASDLNDLLRQLDGYTVTVLDSPRTLHTRQAAVRPLDLTLVEQALQLLTNPNIVFLLLTIGVQAILIELSNPGGWVAGFVGVVCLALAIYGLGLLPVNLFGLLFIIMAFVLFLLEVKVGFSGALTLAGIGSFIAGALILFNSVRLPGFPRISLPLVIATSLVVAASFLTIVGVALRALRRPPGMGRETLIGQRGVVRDVLDPVGSVQVAGELWTAEVSDEEAPLPPGTWVEVVAVEGLRLKVRRLRRE